MGRRVLPRICIVLSLALLPACASMQRAQVQGDSPPLGESKGAAIEVCTPNGQRAYLSRLICPSGEPVAFRRVGSFGPRVALPRTASETERDAMYKTMSSYEALQPGEPDVHIVDGYELTCGTSKRLLYLDMYHCATAPREFAPAGYTLRPAK